MRYGFPPKLIVGLYLDKQSARSVQGKPSRGAYNKMVFRGRNCIGGGFDPLGTLGQTRKIAHVINVGKTHLSLPSIVS
jgi:hypothetical protein